MDNNNTASTGICFSSIPFQHLKWIIFWFFFHKNSPQRNKTSGCWRCIKSILSFYFVDKSKIMPSGLDVWEQHFTDSLEATKTAWQLLQLSGNCFWPFNRKIPRTKIFLSFLNNRMFNQKCFFFFKLNFFNLKWDTSNCLSHDRPTRTLNGTVESGAKKCPLKMSFDASVVTEPWIVDTHKMFLFSLKSVCL